MSWLSRLFAGLLGALLVTGAAWASVPGKKVALVIGNGAYKYAVELPNPKRDEALMASTLKAAGFTVLEGADLDKARMSALIDQFTEAAYDAEVALVYYSGHGMQVDGRNYLVPVDAQLEKPAQLQTRTVSIDQVLSALPPDPAVSVVILDACRDNPLARTFAKSLPASRSSAMGVGLAAVQASTQSSGSDGLLIAYATDPGAVAYDGSATNSPYTTALAKHLTEPGIEIQSALTRVRADVSEATGGAQRPWHNASLGREVFLGPPPSTGQLTVGAAEAGQTSAKPLDAEWTVEQKLWDEASKRNTVAHYELYLQKYPNGSFAQMARLNIDQLKADGETQVASAGQPAPSASQVRTAMAVPEEVRQTPGTAQTEATLNLDKAGRVDLQLRLSALGQDTGGANGAIGPRTREAIGAWQRQNGIPETTFLTPQQHMFLVAQTDPLMAQVRARFEAQKAAVGSHKTQKGNAAVETKTQKTKKKRTQVAEQNPRRDQKIGRVRKKSDGGMDPGSAAFVGGLMGGAIGGLLGR